MYRIAVTNLENGERAVIHTNLLALTYLDRTQESDGEMCAPCILQGSGSLKQTIALALSLKQLLDKSLEHPVVRRVYELSSEVITQNLVDVTAMGLGAMDQEG